MGADWKELNQSVTNNSTLKKTAPEVEEGLGCWLEEERDLSLQMSRHVGQPVEAVIERKFQSDPAGRLKDGIAKLVDQHCLTSAFRIPDGAADIEVAADLMRRTVSASMKLKAPLDRKSTKARINWLLRMLKDDDPRLQSARIGPAEHPPRRSRSRFSGKTRSLADGKSGRDAAFL